VSAHVETSFADKLAERRKQIREAPEHEPEPASLDGDALRSHVRTAPGAAERSSPQNQTPSVASADLGDNLTPVLSVQEIEHRRLRGVLAAIMLLLVGSAVGLLLARQNAASVPAPAPPSVSPATSPATPAAPGSQP